MTQKKLDENYGLLDLDNNISVEEAHHLIDEAIAKHRTLIDEAIAKHRASIDEAIAKHRATIEALELSILTLSIQRNTFAPIIRHLSPEILCKIFSFVRDDNSADFMEDYGVGVTRKINPLTWVNVTHVNRHWRSVAIDWPSLWAHPPFRNLTWVKEMLRRSTEAGLVIDVDISDRSPEFMEGFELALEHAHRIEHLSIYAEADQWHEILPTLPKSIPQLQSLHLSSSYATRSPYDGSIFPKPTLGLEDIPSRMPKLRSLELNYFTVNWDPQSTLLHSLTSLKLHGAVPSPDLTWTWLVDVLKGTSRLEVLDLKDSFPACSEEHIAYGSAHLGFLRELYVSCEPEEGATFLSCITLPPTTRITIDCCVNLHDVLSTSAITFANIFSALAHLYSNMDPASDFRTLNLLQPLLPLDGARLQLFVEALTHEETPSLNDRLAPLDITYTWPSWRSRRALEDIATKAANDLFNSGLPLGNISHVYLTEEVDGFDAETLACTVGELIQVRSIVTTRSIHRILDDALRLGSVNLDTLSGIPSEIISFPNLTSIHFCESRSADSDDEDENYSEDEDVDEDDDDQWVEGNEDDDDNNNNNNNNNKEDEDEV